MAAFSAGTSLRRIGSFLGGGLRGLSTAATTVNGHLPQQAATVCPGTTPLLEPAIPEEAVECVIIGAGIVGLAIARQLAIAGKEVVVLEAASAVGTGTSSRNSEVVHGGIYYPPGSLKAALCVEGRRALYRFCEDRGVAHRRLGKLIVATSQKDIGTLERLLARGQENGVEELRIVGPEEARDLEPNLRCVKALLSPQTGIVDSHGLMLAYLGEADGHGCALALHTSVLGGEVTPSGIRINVCDTPVSSSSSPPSLPDNRSSQSPHAPHPPSSAQWRDGVSPFARASETTAGLPSPDPPIPEQAEDIGEAAGAPVRLPPQETSNIPREGEGASEFSSNPPPPPPPPLPLPSPPPPPPPPTMRLLARTVINAAGLDAVPIATKIQGLPRESIPKRHLARGCYFVLSGVSPPPFRRLIYPVPEDGGLGVHVTVDLGGQLKFGPDVEWLPEPPRTNGIAGACLYDYSVNAKRADKFYPEVRKYFPGLPDGALLPDYAGIRPKISGPGEPAADFLIQGPRSHGVEGLVNLYGIESPGLTAALAIAKHVQKILED